MSEINLIKPKQFDRFILVRSGYYDLQKPANTEIVEASFSHGLGYAPVVLMFIHDEGEVTRGALPHLIFQSSGVDNGKMVQYLSFYVDTNNINVFFETPNIAGINSYTEEINIVLRYYILRESARASV